MRALLLVIFVSACATPEQQRQAEEDYLTSLIVKYGPPCDRAGFKTGTDEWGRCIASLRNEAIRADNQQRLGNVFRDLGSGMTGGGAMTCRPGIVGVTCTPGY